MSFVGYLAGICAVVARQKNYGEVGDLLEKAQEVLGNELVMFSRLVKRDATRGVAER
jgi:hypothetical protein